MKERTIAILFLTLICMFCGCSTIHNNFKAVLESQARKSAESSPFLENSKVFILTRKLETSSLELYRVMFIEKKGGGAIGHFTWRTEMLTDGGVDMRWVVSKKTWEDLCRVVSDPDRSKRIEYNLYHQDKRVASRVDGGFYTFSGFFPDKALHFTLHTASSYYYKHDDEDAIVKAMLSLVPAAVPLIIPEGCSHLVVRSTDRQGKMTSENTYEPDVDCQEKDFSEQSPLEGNNKVIILTRQSEPSCFELYRVILVENKDGGAIGHFTFLSDILANGRIEMRWRINKKNWEDLCALLSDPGRVERIEHGYYHKDKMVTSGLDGAFYTFSGFFPGKALHFTLHTASDYCYKNSNDEYKILEAIFSFVPVSAPWIVPEGCEHVEIKNTDKKGNIISKDNDMH